MQKLSLDRPPSLTEIAAERLATAIVNGRFQPGERLVETALSADFGISRAPVREALRALASEGLVEIRQNRGTFVAKPSLADLESMVLFRGIIEGAAIRLLANRRDENVIATLEKLAVDMEKANNSYRHQDFLRAHWEFHRYITTSCGNKYLERSWNAVSNLIRLYHSLAVGTTIDRDIVLGNNRAFIRALKEPPPEAAEELLRSQIIHVAYRLIGVPIPAAVRAYVTCFVGPDGSVQPVEPEEPAAEGKSP
jgi:DNA-binding GntR family transcriptional regulator